MAKMKLVLGKGLSALLPTEDAQADVHAKESVTRATEKRSAQQQPETNEIPLASIRRNPYQPREEFDQQALQELADSIREHGLIQPVTVRRAGDGYELIAGERRLRAARMAGLAAIPAYVKDVADEAELLELALIENVQREHLNPIEIAHGYKRLMDECNLTQDDIARKVSKDRTTVANFLRLLKLPAKIQDSLRKNELTQGHARALLAVLGADRQIELWKKIVRDGISVRRAEELARALAEPAKEKNTPAPLAHAQPPHNADAAYADLESRLRTLLATHVRIKTVREGKGHIEIEFYNDEDLDRIIELIETIKQS